MFEKIVAHVAALTPEALSEAYLEEMALCAAWLDSHRDSPSRTEPFQVVRKHLDYWVENVRACDEDSEGFRQQPLLRRCLNELIRGRIPEMGRDELDFIYFAWSLSQRAHRDDLFERPLTCLKPFVAQLNVRRKEAEIQPGLPNLLEHLSVYTAEEVSKSDPIELPHFGGLNMKFEGAVLQSKGDTKIIGDVAPGAALLVNDGSCFVRGSVLGHAVVTNHCEVRGDAGGIVVSRKGHVRCGKVLPGSVLIAKEGQVACVRAESPKLIYGCTELRVRSSVLGGRLLSDKIEVGGEMEAVEAHATRQIKAMRFTPGADKGVSLVLRRTITCKDYGEYLVMDAARMLNSALRQRQRVNHLTGLLRLTEQEVDEYAGSVLRFLMGTEVTPEKGDNIQSLQRSSAYLSRLESATRALVVIVEEQLSLDDGTADETGDVNVDIRMLLDELRSDLNALSSEGNVPKEFLEDRAMVVGLAEKLQEKFITEYQTIMTLQELMKVSDHLKEVQQKLEAVIAKPQTAAGVGGADKRTILEKAQESGTRVEVMAQLLQLSRSGKANPGFRKRCTDRYVKLMRGYIEIRNTRIIDYKAQIRKLETAIGKSRDRLWTEFRVSLPPHLSEAATPEDPKAVGMFGDGVRICAWPHLLEENMGDTRGLLVVSDSGDETLSYVRMRNGNIRLED